MKSLAAKAAPREVTPLYAPPPAIPPVVTLKWLYETWGKKQIGMTRLRQALANDPNAPMPICGGGLGSKLLYNGVDVVLWLEKIARPGCWPKEAA